VGVNRIASTVDASSAAWGAAPLTRIATLDAVLDAHAQELAGDFVAYRNHTYRVANLCVALSPHRPDTLEKIAIASAFHDLGIWTNHTFDYLQPSVSLATAYLRDVGKTSWTREIAEMVLEHHKILPYRREPRSLVEPFRRADWVDVSKGLVTFGVSRPLLREIFAVWPSAGFHKRLVQLEFA
jgi:HD domain